MGALSDRIYDYKDVALQTQQMNPNGCHTLAGQISFGLLTQISQGITGSIFNSLSSGLEQAVFEGINDIASNISGKASSISQARQALRNGDMATFNKIYEANPNDRTLQRLKRKADLDA